LRWASASFEVRCGERAKVRICDTPSRRKPEHLICFEARRQLEQIYPLALVLMGI